MLVRYKNSYKKIAMGLLSYMPKEKDIRTLQETIEKYETDNDWELYFWKEEDIIAVVGVHRLENGDTELCHLCVNPSFRDEGIGRKIISALQETIVGRLHPTNETIDFFLATQE